jgi:hypothetical protein
MKDEAFEKAMADFLAKGGVIKQGAYRESGIVDGTGYRWGAPKKPGRPPAGTVAASETPVDEDDL